jgi:hypothetical protein
LPPARATVAGSALAAAITTIAARVRNVEVFMSVLRK